MTVKRLKRPADPIQRGKLIGDILTGQIEDRQAAPEKHSSDTRETACKGGVEKTHNWRSDFDAYYNSGTGLVENNMPSVAELDESEEWQKAFYIFRKCMADQGFPLETRK